MRVEIKNALFSIIHNRKEKALNYAVEYARYAVEMINNECSDEDLRVQLLYVVGNISHWRGQEAKETREVLKAALKGLKK